MKKRSFAIKEGDSVIIFRKNGETEAHIPNQEDDEVVCDTAVSVARCVTMLNTPELLEAVDKRLGEVIEEDNEKGK